MAVNEVVVCAGVWWGWGDAAPEVLAATRAILSKQSLVEERVELYHKDTHTARISLNYISLKRISLN